MRKPPRPASGREGGRDGVTSGDAPGVRVSDRPDVARDRYKLWNEPAGLQRKRRDPCNVC